MEQLKESGIEWIGDIPKNWAVHPVFTYFCERKKRTQILVSGIYYLLVTEQ